MQEWYQGSTSKGQEGGLFRGEGFLSKFLFTFSFWGHNKVYKNVTKDLENVNSPKQFSASCVIAGQHISQKWKNSYYILHVVGPHPNYNKIISFNTYDYLCTIECLHLHICLSFKSYELLLLLLPSVYKVMSYQFNFKILPI